MTPQDPAPVPDGQADAPGGNTPATGPDRNGGASPQPVPDHDNGADGGYEQAASVINNFYAEVSTHNVGVSGTGGQLARPAIRRESGLLPATQASEALRYYLRPAPFSKALKTLTERHLVALVGPEGCGKKAGTLELARIACPDAESYTVLPPTRSLPELASYKHYRSGQAFLLHDWVPVSTDVKSVATFDLEQLAARLAGADAYLAITFENSSRLQVLLATICVPWSVPEPTALLEHCAGKVELRLNDDESKRLRARAAEIRSPRLVIRLAETAVSDIATALAEVKETENSAVTAWFTADLARWKVWAVTALTFLSGVRERKFERLLAALTDIGGIGSARPDDDEHRDEPDDDQPFPQSRWALAKEAGLEEFLAERHPVAPVGSEHRPAFRSKAHRLHFMTELNLRFGDELWTPVRDWLFMLADQPFGEAQVAAGYGLALLARRTLLEVEATYLTPWAAGNLRQRLMAVNVLWAMAEDDLCAPAALRIAVGWVRNRGQERAITAALAFGGPLGERYPSEALRWLWMLARRGERIRPVANTAIGQLFAVEAQADLEKGAVIRFVLQKIRSVLAADAPASERRAALAVVNTVLGVTQLGSEAPVVASVLRTRSADFRPLGELWAAVLNSVPHRQAAITTLHDTLAALTDGVNSLELAARLGAMILPRLTTRSFDVLELALPDPERSRELSVSIIDAFLGTPREVAGTRGGTP